jgi:hypothetical protein
MWNLIVYLVQRLAEPSTQASLAAGFASIAVTASHPTVQAVAGTLTALSTAAGFLLPEGRAKLAVAVGGDVARAVSANTAGNTVNAGAAAVGAIQAAVVDLAPSISH